MTLTEIQAQVAAGEFNLALPQHVEVEVKCLIVSLTTSSCCKAKELLVLSRPGGFVARDCLVCGKQSKHITLDQIPDLDCVGCLKYNRAGTVEPVVGPDKDYLYRCTGCGREWRIPDIVPVWSGPFEYAGVAAPGDPAFGR